MYKNYIILKLNKGLHMHVLVNSQELVEIKNLQEEILKKLSLQMNNNTDELISLETAEKLTGLEYQKLRQMFLDGELIGKRFGRAIRVSKFDLLRCTKESI